MPYFEVELSFEGKEDLEEGYSPRDDFDGEYLWIHDNFYDTPTFIEITLFLRQECTFHSMKEIILEMWNP